MRVKLFSVFDVKAKAHNAPFPTMNAPMALRMFANCVNNPQHAYGANPEDYSLFMIGTFDDETGVIEPCQELVANGLQCVKLEGE